MTRKTLQKTSIEWTDYSWNPIRARNRETGTRGWYCEHASDGCRFCYAETINRRLGTGVAFARQNRDQVEIFLDEDWLRARMPAAPAKIFVCDMSDLFAPFVPEEWIARIVDVATSHPERTFQLLTKRPVRMRDFFARRPASPNLWLGTSIEQRRHLGRMEILRGIDAARRFVSLEPLLGDLGGLDLDGIGWVITGAESGGRARPMQLDWVRRIRDQCIAAGVAFFFKQDTKRGRKIPLPELDGRQWQQFSSVEGRQR